MKSKGNFVSTPGGSDAIKRLIVPDKRSYVVLGVDPARPGKDKTVRFVIDGELPSAAALIFMKGKQK